ncbi:MAG TPA: DNA cytosine methyltransferase [Blastocatellia bacterium]|nr:DNA cytosine methyltransferase [Blastocatellia bacterium]
MQQTLFELASSGVKDSTWSEEILRTMGISRGPAWPDYFGVSLRQWFASHQSQPVRTLSLFSGGGGLDIAFHDAGFEAIQMVEIDARYSETLRANFSLKSKVTCIDIREFEPGTDFAVDFIIGGPPCQTFSAAGRRAAGVAGTSDPRGALFEEYIRLLGIIQPKGFLFENVYGITGAQDGQAWREIQTAFKAVGYNLFFRVLDAADYGVPQHRERLFIVGLKEGSYLFPCPTHGPDSPGHEPYFTAGEAVQGADISEASAGLGGRYGHLLNGIPPGLNYSFYTKEMGHPRPVFSWRSKFSDFLYKADPAMPVRTIKAQGGQYTGPFSWENRAFTIPELKRLQTFPDSYQIVGGRMACLEQIGNSVPPQLGRLLALSILDQVFGVSLPFAMHYLPADRPLGFRQRKRLLTERYSRKARMAIEGLSSHPPGQAQAGVGSVTEDVRFLGTDFSWSDRPAPGSTEITITCDLNSAGWHLKARRADATGEGEKYLIEIKLPPRLVSNGRSRPRPSDYLPRISIRAHSPPFGRALKKRCWQLSVLLTWSNSQVIINISLLLKPD